MYYEFYEIRKWYEGANKLNQDPTFIASKQIYKFSKKIAYLKNRDPMNLIALCPSSGSLSTIRDHINDRI